MGCDPFRNWFNGILEKPFHSSPRPRLMVDEGAIAIETCNIGNAKKLVEGCRGIVSFSCGVSVNILRIGTKLAEIQFSRGIKRIQR